MTRAVFVIVLVVAAGLVRVAPVAADPPEPTHASCIGIEATNVSPPGSNSEAPGGINDFVPLPGSFVRQVAQLRLQTHEDCDRELE